MNFVETLENLSLCDIEKTYVVLYDAVGVPVVPDEVCTNIYNVWSLQSVAEEGEGVGEVEIQN